MHPRAPRERKQGAQRRSGYEGIAVKKQQRQASRISLELVPRDEEGLQRELNVVKDLFHQVNTVNIPDLWRFQLRSWEGCALAQSKFAHTIPHIRARDLDPDAPLPMAGYLQEKGIQEVLVITGDVDSKQGEVKTGCTALEAIAKFKRELPELKVYAAIDPYRAGPKEELAYIQQKLEVGADGFFTQPFFDLRLMEIYAEQLQELEVFWGVSPVTSETSREYWEKRNRVVFPRKFVPTLEWNREFASQALTFVRKLKGSIYFMPIRTDIKQYLKGILT